MPGVVKGSKQEKMVVVPYRPGRRLFFTAALLAGVAISALGGFAYGYYQTLLTQESARADRAEMEQELASVKEENSDLNRQIAILDRSSVMDQRANEEVQQTISGLRDRVAQLEQDIVYYRGVVSEEIEDTGLIISQLDIDGTGNPDIYRYKLVVRQRDADGDTYLLGHVNVNLVGRQGDEVVIIPLRDISEEQDELDIRLRFRYFQNIEGELALPEGFIPERVQIAAVETEPLEKTLDQDFSWVVGE
ncbi:MAG: hypothetical protein OXU66_15475 [Gammaproteobacteria bacterium]|nr:hypothetical protein [Gammaproteobacteria bacterium]MDD9894421.1 hypothetical protein [Gammaproteobacteria bacterium]MDD9960317.1 hypothetical protein [Gammaproteobacteria bacterium]